jgi:hypothetical protein
MGMAVGGIGLLSGIIGMTKNSKTHTDNINIVFNAIDERLRRSGAIIRGMVGSEAAGGMSSQLQAYINEIEALNIAIAYAKGKRDEYGVVGDTFTKIYNDGIKKLEDLKLEYADLDRQYKELLTGTTAETIADSIASGFEDGLSSVNDFAGSFKDIMRKAIIDSFKRDIISQYLTGFMDTFSSFSEGGLTGEELDKLRDFWDVIIRDAGQQYSSMEEILGLVGGAGNAAKTGMSGAIAGITQETAGLLAGQINVLVMNSVTVRDDVFTMKNSVSVMAGVALDNLRANQETAVNTRYLKSIDMKLSYGANRALGA